MEQITLTLPKLICKPADNRLVYSKFHPSINGTVSFRSLNVDTDLKEIHRWVNLPYAVPFWQMDGSLDKLIQVYSAIQESEYAHSFVGLFNGKLVCQLDLYVVGKDEVAKFLSPAEGRHCGIHFLMAPVSTRTEKGLTRLFFSEFLFFYFTHPGIEKMYGEPDMNNSKSISLVESCGFRRIKTVQMSYKKAHLYCLTLENFYLHNK